jgi:nitroreductase
VYIKNKCETLVNYSFMIDLINRHRSIRKFSDKIIPEHILNDVLYAGTRASTTGNMQVYSMVVTTRSDLKQNLLGAHFNQKMVVEAPVIITFCADFNRFTKWCNFRKADPAYDNFLSFFTAAIDALLSAQNVALAAESKDLGICYLGTTIYTADQIIDILSLPKLVIPVTTLVIGYPNESPELTDRLPLKAVVHNETYNDFTEEDMNSLYREKESLKLTLQLLKENNKETLAQIFTDNRYKRSDNIVFSNKYLETIKKQGFMNNQ